MTFQSDTQIAFTTDDNTTPVTERTYILLIVYACISAIWILTAVIALVGLCSPPTRKAQLGCFLPFLIAVIAGSILDVVATVFFGIDIGHTTVSTLTNFLKICSLTKFICRHLLTQWST